LTKLMSKDFTCVPGIVIAVRHLVWVFEGAPGPVQGPATATPAAARNTIPNSAIANARDGYRYTADSLDMDSSSIPYIE
jgi:hypothetical protein